MHYKNGREALSGDPVIAKLYSEVVAGTIYRLNPSATSCNGMVAIPIPGGTRLESVNVQELYHAEDAFKSIDSAVLPVPAAQTK